VTESSDAERTRLRVPGAAYLLSQVGAHSSRRWRQRLERLDLDPREAVVLRHVAAGEGRSQSSLEPALGVPASRIVTLIDRLEDRGLLVRRPNPDDRRAHALSLTGPGRSLLAKVLELSKIHEADICAGLDDIQRQQLIDLLVEVAAHNALPEGSHPGMAVDEPN
jgi:DNA-binding MarR family transcriptional regulator